jgi:hypothetical protein
MQIGLVVILNTWLKLLKIVFCFTVRTTLAQQQSHQTQDVNEKTVGRSKQQLYLRTKN